MAATQSSSVPNSGGSKPTIAPLGEDNFNVWSVRIKDLFRTNKMALSNSDVEKDLDAAAFIRLYIDESYMHIVGNMKSAKEVFDALEKLHSGKAQARAFNLVRTLVNIRKEHTESIRGYITRAGRLRNDLVVLGETFTDLVFVAIVLQGLPEEYQQTREVIVNLTDKLTMDIVTPRLTAREDAIKSGLGQEQEGRALAALAPKKHCTFCTSNTHWTSECRKLKKKNNKEEKAAAVASLAVAAHAHNGVFVHAAM